jgi:hypothetical protein
VVIEWYCICKKSEESIEHLLLHCEVARDLWSYILTLFGLKWVMSRMVLDLLTSWGASFMYGPVKEVWRLVPLCLMWCIWREQNVPHFEDVEISMVELKKRLLNTLYIWIAFHHSLNVFTYADFLNLFYVRSY